MLYAEPVYFHLYQILKQGYKYPMEYKMEKIPLKSGVAVKSKFVSISSSGIQAYQV